ncbi:MAG: 6-phosphofructokinase [Clostridia bacterium]|nr:6-phosphofructokinase [Clostridia bacterium]
MEQNTVNESPRIKRIAVLTSGGDAPGMNAAVRAVVRTAASLDLECVGIKRGWQGLINADFMMLTRDSVKHILPQGGTMLYTARSEEFMLPSGRQKAAATCRMLGIDAVVAIGGDGTFRGALELSREGVPVVGIPATIDNDVDCSNYTIGFDTACNTAVDCIDRLRDTMQAHERCSVVEVMGRNAGYLALYVGIAAGATVVLVPEQEYDFKKDIVERIQAARLAGNTHFMIVVAEGAGSAMDIGKRIEEAIGIAPRVTVLGHIQRGGSPTARDRETATRMGYNAVRALYEGRKNLIIATKEGSLVEIPIEEALHMKKHLQMDRYNIMGVMQLGALKLYVNEN